MNKMACFFKCDIAVYYLPVVANHAGGPQCAEPHIYLLTGFLHLLQLFHTNVFPYLINGIDEFL